MHHKLDTLTNVVVIGVALVIGGLFVKDHLALKQPASALRPGETVSPLPGYSWSSSPFTLVVALKDGCRYCEANMPFYRQLNDLSTQHRLRCQIVAVFPDSDDTVRQLLSKQALSFRAVSQMRLSTLHVFGTPTLFLIDQRGVVQRVWTGALEAGAQADVLAAVLKS